MATWNLTGRAAMAGLRGRAGAGAILAAAALAGCEERTAPPPPAPAQQPVTVLEGGGSAAGKAIDNAHNLKDQVKAHNDEIEKQIDDMNKK